MGCNHLCLSPLARPYILSAGPNWLMVDNSPFWGGKGRKKSEGNSTSKNSFFKKMYLEFEEDGAGPLIKKHYLITPLTKPSLPLGMVFQGA